MPQYRSEDLLVGCRLTRASKLTLEHDHSALDLLRIETGDAAILQVSAISISGSFTWREQDNWRPLSCPVLSIPPESLRESASRGVVVIQELLEGPGPRDVGRAVGTIGERCVELMV